MLSSCCKKRLADTDRGTIFLWALMGVIFAAVATICLSTYLKGDEYITIETWTLVWSPPSKSAAMLHKALRNNDANMAVSLIHAGADVHQRTPEGELPIQLAVDLHDDEDAYWALKHLVLAGASLEDVPEERRGAAPYRTFQREYEEYWREQVEDGLERIPRWRWIRRASPEAVAQLLEHSQFWVNELDSRGVGPLDEAVRFGNGKVARCLIENGACCHTPECFQKLGRVISAVWPEKTPPGPPPSLYRETKE